MHRIPPPKLVLKQSMDAQLHHIRGHWPAVDHHDGSYPQCRLDLSVNEVTLRLDVICSVRSG